MPDPSYLIRAFCKQYDVNTATGDYLEAPAGQGSATWNIQAGQGLDCDWYNFTYVQPENGNVTVHLNMCPTGFDGAGASIYDFAFYCKRRRAGSTSRSSTVMWPQRTKPISTGVGPSTASRRAR